MLIQWYDELVEDNDELHCLSCESALTHLEEEPPSIMLMDESSSSSTSTQPQSISPGSCRSMPVKPCLSTSQDVSCQATASSSPSPALPSPRPLSTGPVCNTTMPGLPCSSTSEDRVFKSSYKFSYFTLKWLNWRPLTS